MFSELTEVFNVYFHTLYYFFHLEPQIGIVTLSAIYVETRVFLRDFLTQDSFNLSSNFISCNS